MVEQNHARFRARTELYERLAANVDDEAIERLDAGFLTAARQCVALRRRWWRTGKRIDVDEASELKMRVVYPLAMHALANVELALKIVNRAPWVAAANARVAFEYSLAAQWVVLTHGGEQQIVDAMNVELDKRTRGFHEGLGSPEDYAAMVDEVRPTTSYSVWNACTRFSEDGNGAKLFYDMYRHLGEGVHPSIGSLSAYVKVDIQFGGVRRWDPTGAMSGCDHTTAALGCSALWALDALEELRSGQPNVQQLRDIGDEVSLPYTLRWSDQKPHLQHPNAGAC